MTDKLYNEITAWQTKTFGQSTSLSKIAHLSEEIRELASDIANNNPDKRLEFADCFFLLFGAAASEGMSYEDIISAIEEKFEINKARKWGKPNENGVVNHIKE